MSRRFQAKVFAAVLGALLLIFTAVLLFLNFAIYQISAGRIDDYMLFVMENDGFPRPLTGSAAPHMQGAETFRAGRFFYARQDHDGGIIELNLDMMFDFSPDEALRYISSAVGTELTRGNVYNFSFLSADKPYGRMFVFAERSAELFLLDNLNIISIYVSGVVSLILLCCAALLAKWMVAPLRSSFAKQRRFVADAGHELKTPLTIISANIDVLENEIGENKWLSHIRSQSERMNGLIHGLLTLARADERKAGITRSKFNLSSAILNTVLEFEGPAFEEGKQYSYEIKEDIAYDGDEKQIKQLASILIDNAIRYSNENGQVKISLDAEGTQIKLSVFNTGTGISGDERSKIFDRFYRTDESRSRETGGFGIGLSSAKAIVGAHKGTLEVAGEHMKWVRFDVALKRTLNLNSRYEAQKL